MASQPEGLELNPPSGCFTFSLSAWVLSAYSGVLPQSKDMQVVELGYMVTLNCL